MKILHVIPTFAPAWRYGGPMRSVDALARAQVQAGDGVSVFTTNRDGDDVLDVPVGTPIDRSGVEVRYYATAPPRRIFRSPGLGEALVERAAAVDLLHLHSVFLWPTYAGARAAAQAGRPWVVSPRGMLVRDLIAGRGWLRKRLWIALCERRTLAGAAAIHLTSELEKTELEGLGLDLAPVEVVPNGVELAAAPDEPEGEIAAAAAKALATDGFVLFLGRLSWKKGVELIVDAMPHLPEATVVLAGPDEDGLAPALEERARKRGVAHRLMIVGEVGPRVRRRLFERAVALVLASRSENFGNSVLEAMAAGVPVVVSREVGLAPEVEAAGAGFVVERTGEAIAAGVRRLLDNPAEAREMGDRGRRRAAALFSWGAVAARMRGLYERALLRSGKAAA